jgi:hypothetical protein
MITRRKTLGKDGTRPWAGGGLSRPAGKIATLVGLLGFALLSAGSVVAGQDRIAQEKPLMARTENAATTPRTIPPLDASQPARLETFTFGLG